MPAIITGALALLVGGIILSARIRNVVFGALAGIRDYVAGAWPTWAQFRQATGPIWITLAILLGLIVASWILFFFVMLGVGIAINAPWSGVLIGLFFPAWCILYIIRLGRLTRIPYVIATIILLLAIPMFVLGAWSPDVKGEFGRWTGNKKGELANAFGKNSVQSEPEAGIIGFASEDGVVVYNIKDRRTPVERLKSGVPVMVVNLKGKPVDEDAEGMVPVKLANEYGDFNGKLNGWVVSRKISWNKPRRPELSLPPPPPPTPEQALANSRLAAMPAPAPPAPSLPPSEKFDWEVRRTHITEDGREVNYTNLRSLSLSADRQILTMKEKWHGGVFVYEGCLTADREYTGTFSVNGKPWGEFQYTLSSDEKSGEGYQISSVRYGSDAREEEVVLKKVLE